MPKGVYVHSKDHMEKVRACIKPENIRRGEGHNWWRGDRVGYSGVHKWLVYNFGNPKKCEDCGSMTMAEWANISGKLERKRESYKGLCRKCHTKFDDVVNKSWKTRKRGFTKEQRCRISESMKKYREKNMVHRGQAPGLRIDVSDAISVGQREGGSRRWDVRQMGADPLQLAVSDRVRESDRLITPQATVLNLEVADNIGHTEFAARA